MYKLNLQMFNEPTIEGIDADIVASLADEMPANDEAQNNENVAAAADADSDNKAEQNNSTANNEQEYEPEEGTTVPYARFKAINERMKAAEARLKELETTSKGEAAEQEPMLPKATPAPAQQQQPSDDDFTGEALTKITELAMDAVKTKLNLSDDDIENMEYSDNAAQKYAYNAAVAEEINRIKRNVRQHQAEQNAYNVMIDNVAKRFAKEAEDFQKLPNSDAIWAHVCDSVANERPETQTMLNDSLIRLQNKRGTYQDFYVIKNYLDKAKAAFQAPQKSTNNKLKNVSGLPKAPNVSGATSSDTVYTPEKIAEILNQQDGWDTLPSDIQQKLLKGTL